MLATFVVGNFCPILYYIPICNEKTYFVLIFIDDTVICKSVFRQRYKYSN